MKKTLAAFMLALTVFCTLFAACGSNPVGIWKFKSMTGEYGGVAVDYKAGDKMNGVSLTENFCVIEIKEDKTFTMTLFGEKMEGGTWEEKDGKLLLTADGVVSEAKVSGKTLEMNEEGFKITLKKS